MQLKEIPTRWLNELKYDENGLIPAIIQDVRNREVLMMAYMDQEAIAKTLTTGETWFYSRSRRELWHKGGTSGHRQLVKEIRYDCDADTLLILVEQNGGACHEGYRSCFYRQLTPTGHQEVCLERMFDPAEVYRAGEAVAPERGIEPALQTNGKTETASAETIIEEVYQVIMDRKQNRPEGSYTAYLFNQGQDKICKKVGEEAAEVIIAAKNKSKAEILYEMADLWYHTLVLLGEHDIHPAEVFAQLRQRR